MSIPLPAVLFEALESTPRRSVTILGFRTSWGKACKKGLTFHDLRGTVVTRFAMAGRTAPEIAAITEHSLKDAQAILDAQLPWGERTASR